MSALRLTANVAWAAVLWPMLTLAGCHGTHRASSAMPMVSLHGLTRPAPVATVEAVAAPPVGWVPQPLKQSHRHTHQIWLSPSGNTAYGIIHIHMPLPVGPELALMGFMQQMRRTEGEGVVLSKRDDQSLPGIRFEAEGGRYHIRVNLLTHGWQAWAIYAGTLRGRPEVPAELELAERAREATIIGLPEGVEPHH